MDKTTREYAEQLAEKSIYVTKAFEHGYMAAIEECNVKQLQEENERLREALEKITTGTHPYNEFEAFSFVDTAKSIARNALSK